MKILIRFASNARFKDKVMEHPRGEAGLDKASEIIQPVEAIMRAPGGLRVRTVSGDVWRASHVVGQKTHQFIALAEPFRSAS